MDRLLNITTPEHLMKLNREVYTTYVTTEEYCMLSVKERKMIADVFIALQEILTEKRA